MPDRVYLDWNATTPLRPEARAAMAAAWDLAGNPSSVHAEGRQARRLVEDARAAVAAAVGALPRNVVFTSCGTEANALALSPGVHEAARPAGPAAFGLGHRARLGAGRRPVSAGRDRKHRGHAVWRGRSRPVSAASLPADASGAGLDHGGQ